MIIECYSFNRLCFFAIGAGDHPFLRMYQGMENLSLEGPRNGDGGAGPLVRRQTTEEEDMAFFEKRYQERVRA